MTDLSHLAGPDRLADPTPVDGDQVGVVLDVDDGAITAQLPRLDAGARQWACRGRSPDPDVAAGDAVLVRLVDGTPWIVTTEPS